MRRQFQGDVDLCVYCGDIATQKDHVPPRRLRPELIMAGISFEAHLVPACADCNHILGGHNILTIRQRRDFVRHRLWDRHWNLIRSPAWRDSELAELGPGLRGYIRALQGRRERVLRRIGMLRTIA